MTLIGCCSKFTQYFSAPPSPHAPFLLVDCPIEKVRTQASNCLANHPLNTYLLFVALAIQSKLEYLASTIFDSNTYLDAFVGLNEGEVHLIDLSMDDAAITKTIEGRTFNVTKDEVIRIANAMK